MFRRTTGLIVRSNRREINSIQQNSRIITRFKSVSSDSSTDSVSPSHSVSNLRLIKFGRHEKESDLEQELRTRRTSLQEWNHSYWLKNNTDFQKQKLEYIENELRYRDREFKAGLAYDELALFYKKFLDENHRKHMDYNLEWYKRQTGLLWPAFRAALIRLKRKLLSNEWRKS